VRESGASRIASSIEEADRMQMRRSAFSLSSAARSMASGGQLQDFPCDGLMM